MSLTSRSIRRISETLTPRCVVLHGRSPGIVASALSLEFPAATAGPRELPHLHRQQRRHFAAKDKGKGKNDDRPALKRQAVKKKASVSTGPSEESLAANKTYQMVVAALDAPKTKPPPASKEEMDRRYQVGRNYVIGSFESHNELEHDVNCKIRLKNHAIKMLPKNSLIQKAAMETDDEGPPKWRHIPMWTPPIPGFDPDDFIEEGSKELD